MKSRTFIVVLAGIAVGLAVLIVLSVVTPPVPVAILHVVDANGRPVAGAMILPDGLRPKKGGAHYSWSGVHPRSGLKAGPVQTDAQGDARVAYPIYVEEKLETGEISFTVDHPDFCADRPFRTVASSPPANAAVLEKLKYFGMVLLRRVRTRPDPVVLKLGGIVKLTGHIGSPGNVVTNLQAEISHEWEAGTNFWQRTGPVLWSRKVVEGQTFLRALSITREGPALFGDAVSFMTKPGETNEFAFELKPGVRVTGRLDESVPRPVLHGRVCIREFIQGQDGDSEAPVWDGWRPLGEDGTFVFESLPEGRVEMIGLCDGFVSRNGTPRPGVATSQRLPQLFEIEGRAQDLTLAMEPAAVCEVTVLDDEGKPLAGASAAFWPNVLWGGNGSTVFADGLFNTEDYYRLTRLPDGAAIQEQIRKNFRATSDGRGVATVINLPAGPQYFRVSHTNYDMPLNRAGGGRTHRSAAVRLSAGETGKVVVTMQKKGVEPLTH